jgi:hypothetical protein
LCGRPISVAEADGAMRTTKALKELASAVNHLAARQDKIEAILTASAGANGGAGALEKFAVAAVEHQASQLGAVGNLIETIANVAGERAARALGKRRAATARRDPKGRMLKNACRLCENPNLTDPQASEIMAHATHGTRPAAPGAPREQTHLTTAYLPGQEPIPIEIKTDPATGAEVVECKECGQPVNGADHGHDVQSH